MKQLLSLILSFQLISFPVLGAATSQNNEISNPEQELSDPNKNAETDTGTNAAYDARSQGGGGYQNFSKQILGASTAIIGANIIKACPLGGKMPSILTFMAGAIAYLVSEVSGGKKQNQEHKERLERIEKIKEQVAANKGGGDVQRVLLEQRLEEEEKVLEFVQERNKWGMAIMAIYTVAAALAIMEETTAVAAATAAGVSACAADAARVASPCSGPAYPGCYAAAFATCQGVHPLGQLAAKAAFMSPTSQKIGADTCKTAVPYSLSCSANLTTYLGLAWASCKPGPTVAVGPFSLNLYSLAFGMGMGYSSAGNLQSLLQLAVGLTGLFTTAISSKVTALYSYPIPRSITFGAHAALMGVIIAGLKGVESQTKENISELKKVVNQFREHTDDHEGMHKGGNLAQAEGKDYHENEIQAGSANGKALSLKNDPKALNKLDMNISKSKNCFSNDSGNMDVSEAACKKPVTIKPITVKVKQHKGQSLDRGVQLINDMNKSLESGNFDAARSSASELATMAVALRSDLKKLQDDYNKSLPKKDRIDFDERVQKLAKELDNDSEARKIFDQFEKEQGIKVASFGQQGKVALDSAEDTSAKQEITTAQADEAIALKSGSDLNSAAQAAEELLVSEGPFAEATDHLDENDLLYGGDKTSNNPFGLNEDAFRAAMANGYTHLHSKNGYSAGEGVAAQKENLFKIISNRYFLSYPKIMRKKITEGPVTE